MTRHPRTADAQYERDNEKEPDCHLRRTPRPTRYRFGIAQWLCHGCQRYGGGCVCPQEES